MPEASLSAVSIESVSRCFGAGLHGEPVDDHLDRVLLLLLELGRLGQRVHDPVDPGPGEALGLQLGEEVDILPLAAPDHRREHLEPGALVHRQHPVDDLLRRLPGDGEPADRAVRLTGAGEEQPQVVVDLGDRADGRARVAGGRLLVDGDGRAQALDEVDVGLVHLAEELPGVRRERLDVAALALGEDRVEGQAGLAGAGQPGEHDQGVAGQLEVDVAQVVLARAPDDQPVMQESPTSPTGMSALPRFCLSSTAAHGCRRNSSPAPRQERPGAVHRSGLRAGRPRSGRSSGLGHWDCRNGWCSSPAAA